MWPFKTKASKTHKVILQNALGVARRTIFTDSEAFARQGYIKNVFVYSAIRLVSMHAGTVPWIARNKTTKEEIEGHPSLELLKIPNPFQAQSEFIERVISFKLIDGNSYIEYAGVKSNPIELWSLRPDRMEILPSSSPKNPILGYRYRVGVSEHIFKPDRILHLKNFHPLDDFYGLSPLKPAALSIDINNEGKVWNRNLIENSASPPGYFVTKEFIKEEQAQKIKKDVQDQFAGALNAGKPFLITGGFDFVGLSLKPVELEWLEGQKQSAAEILIPFGVPPELVGLSEHKTYNNFREANRALWLNAVIPELDHLRDGLNMFFEQFWPDIEIDYDTNAITALQEDREKLFDRVQTSTFLTINEKRISTGFEPIPEGDVILTPLSMVPLETSVDREIKQKSDKVHECKARGLLPDRAIDRVANTAKNILDSQTDEVLRIVKRSANLIQAENEAVVFIEEDKSSWDRFFRSVFLGVSPEFANMAVLDLTGEEVKLALPSLTKQVEAGEIEQRIIDYTSTVSGKKISNITDTTLKEVRGVFQEAVLAEESIDQVAVSLQKRFTQINKVRSVVISRTEMIAAANAGNQIGAQATGLNIAKTWNNSGDDLVRENPDHRVTQTRALNEPYVIGGERLMFPGDVSFGASGKNIIQCRCFETYEVID